MLSSSGVDRIARLDARQVTGEWCGCSTLIRTSVPFSISWYQRMVDTMQDRSTCYTGLHIQI